MEQYTNVSFELARTVTLRYSTSFGQSSKLFDKSIRPYIYAIYGLVRVADEIVDTYKGTHTAKLLNSLEAETIQAMESGFSANPLVHAFAATARQFSIGEDLVRPFFESMRMDVTMRTYTKSEYNQYIYGSAEVIGLMCLKVFCNDEAWYQKLEAGAKALGAAYQKVNFLRDFKADYEERGRVYFPGITFKGFNDKQKDTIISDIEKDFKKAKQAIVQLPDGAKKAVSLSAVYYGELLQKLKRASAADIMNRRLRVNTAKKLQLLVAAHFQKDKS